jgi:hypothetical protein
VSRVSTFGVLMIKDLSTFLFVNEVLLGRYMSVAAIHDGNIEVYSRYLKVNKSIEKQQKSTASPNDQRIPNTSSRKKGNKGKVIGFIMTNWPPSDLCTSNNRNRESPGRNAGDKKII